MKSNLSLKSLKGNLLNKEELSKLNELESLTPEYESLLKTRKRLTQKLADVNNRITAIENNQKQVALLLKKNNHHLHLLSLLALIRDGLPIIALLRFLDLQNLFI